jgi:hypothetical protein
MQRWRVGDVTITRIIETEDASMSAAIMLPDATPANLAAIGWAEAALRHRRGTTHQQRALAAGRKLWSAHRHRYLPRQRQGADRAAVEPPAGPLPGRDCCRGLCARAGGLRGLHPSASGPRGLEHHAGGWPLAADLSVGTLYLQRAGLGVAGSGTGQRAGRLRRGFGATGIRFRTGRVRRTGLPHHR